MEAPQTGVQLSQGPSVLMHTNPFFQVKSLVACFDAQTLYCTTCVCACMADVALPPVCMGLYAKSGSGFVCKVW